MEYIPIVRDVALSIAILLLGLSFVAVELCVGISCWQMIKRNIRERNRKRMMQRLGPDPPPRNTGLIPNEC